MKPRRKGASVDELGAGYGDDEYTVGMRMRRDGDEMRNQDAAG